MLFKWILVSGEILFTYFLKMCKVNKSSHRLANKFINKKVVN